MRATKRGMGLSRATRSLRGIAVSLTLLGLAASTIPIMPFEVAHAAGSSAADCWGASLVVDGTTYDAVQVVGSPDGVVEGDIIYGGYGWMADLEGLDATGSILLAEWGSGVPEVTSLDVLVDNAISINASAVAVYDNEGGPYRDPMDHSRTGYVSDIPLISLSVEDGDALQEMTEEGVRGTIYAGLGASWGDLLPECSSTGDSSLTQYYDNGDFYLLAYEDSTDYASAAETLQGWELLEDEIRWLNENFRLPYDVPVAAKECGEANAFYTKGEGVTICYELVNDLYVLWSEFNDDSEGADMFAYNNAYETFYHEVGHAVLDIYKLPFTGLEENVADQFSALMLTYTYDAETGHTIGQDMLYDVGKYYWYSTQRDGDSTPYWDTHASNMQRFYNISCYAYGADPAYNQDLVDEDWLPEGRAIGCAGEYAQIEYAFDYLLSDYTNGFFDY